MIAHRLAATMIALAAAMPGASVPLAAQTPARPMASGTEAAAAVEEARQAQRRFERIRRASLPIEQGRGTSRCDTRVGRYCYWYDTTARPPEGREARAVTIARRRLLERLDALAAAAPDDAWISGQQVRYRIDALDTAGAVHLTASGCSDRDWWCDALRGYALHVAGEHVASELAFDRALAAMPQDDRCAWENPAMLLPRPARDRVDQLSCTERRRLSERLWWLAVPLLYRPGNELRTEFFARRVESVLEADARLRYDARSSRDATELMVRFGWSTWWTRERPVSLSLPATPALVGHSPTPAFDFLPNARIIFDTAVAASDSAWDVAGAAPAMRYAPPYVARWLDANAQVVRLQRVDTLLVIAAFEVAPDSALRAPVARLVVSPGPSQGRYTSPAVGVPGGTLVARLPGGPARSALLASVEVIDTARRSVARYREVLGGTARGRLELSDLLLHRPLDRPAATVALEDVITHALPSLTVAGEQVGVYWETYGIDPAGETLDVVLAIERLDASLLQRTAVRLRLADRVSPAQVRWKEAPNPEARAPARTVAVNIANLATGEYRLQLRVRGDDGAEAVSERVLRVAR